VKKQVLTFFLLFGTYLFSFSQDIDKVINAGEAERIENVLASDSMQGRKTFTPSIDKAADFISAEFKKAGLQYFGDLQSYRQPFAMFQSETISASGKVNESNIDSNNIIAITTEEDLNVDDKSGYTTVVIDSTTNLLRSAYKLITDHKKYLVLVSTINEKNFSRLKFLNRPSFDHQPSVVFILTDEKPATWHFEIKIKSHLHHWQMLLVFYLERAGKMNM